MSTRVQLPAWWLDGCRRLAAAHIDLALEAENSTYKLTWIDYWGKT